MRQIKNVVLIPVGMALLGAFGTAQAQHSLPTVQPTDFTQPYLDAMYQNGSTVYQGVLPVARYSTRLVDPTDSRTDTVAFTQYTGRDAAGNYYIAPLNRNLVNEAPYVETSSDAYREQYADNRAGMRQLDAQNRRSGYRIVGQPGVVSAFAAPTQAIQVAPSQSQQSAQTRSVTTTQSTTQAQPQVQQLQRVLQYNTQPNYYVYGRQPYLQQQYYQQPWLKQALVQQGLRYLPYPVQAQLNGNLTQQQILQILAQNGRAYVQPQISTQVQPLLQQVIAR